MKTMKYLLIFGLVIVLALAGVVVVSAVSGAAFTTSNPGVDGLFKEVCKNSLINGIIYGSKPEVGINSDPTANGLGLDGQYFFAVLFPGGQPNPNDDGPKTC